jgi:DNA-binding MarR family transcriptional regulator
VSPALPFTDKQGQYLAFIYAYSRIFRQPPAEADMQRHFQVSPPSVHQMVLTLERAGLIRRAPGVARSIELLVAKSGNPAALALVHERPLTMGVSADLRAE